MSGSVSDVMMMMMMMMMMIMMMMTLTIMMMTMTGAVPTEISKLCNSCCT